MPKTNFSLEGPESDGIITVGMTYTTTDMAQAVALIEVFAALAAGIRSPLEMFGISRNLTTNDREALVDAPMTAPATAQTELPFDHSPAPVPPSTEDLAEADAEVKRRRGRPPGSKNAPKPAPEPVSANVLPSTPDVRPPPTIEKTPEVIAELKANIAAIEAAPVIQQGQIDPPFGADDALAEKMIDGCINSYKTYGGEKATFRNTLQYLYLTPGLPTTGNPEAVKAWCLTHHDRVPTLAESPDLASRLDRAIALVCKGA